MTPTPNAAAALDAALNSECAVHLPDGTLVSSENKNLWCGLSDNQKALVREAVRAAVDEEREKCAQIVNKMRPLPASEYIGTCVVDMEEAFMLIREAPR